MKAVKGRSKMGSCQASQLAARMAREFWAQHDLKDEERGCFAREEIADFLRAHGVEGV